MKKVALSLAGVLAAAAFAPEASAIPAFARQTGMACNACHQQHYPVLNGFGQAFKATGYTLMGAQNKVEGEHMSIPENLNAAILLKARYQKTSGTVAANSVRGATTNSGQWQIPDELSFFMGGRVADSDMIKIGFMNENNLVGGPAGGIVAGFKVPIVVDLGAAKVMAIPYITDALGQAYGFEQSSTGMTRGIRWAEHRKEISAAQYTGVGAGTASGLAFVVHHEMGYVNISKWSPAFAYVPDATGVSMSATWLRIAATPSFADWNLHIGLGLATGAGRASAADAKVDTKGSAFDVQAQGAVAGMDTSVYFQTSTANKSSGTRANLYNSSTVNDITATTIGADVSIIPHTLHVGAAMRNAKTNSAKSDNAITVTAVYDLFQNIALHANYSMYSGDKYNGTPANGKSLLTLMLEAAW